MSHEGNEGSGKKSLCELVLPFGAHSMVGGDIDGVCGRVMAHGQTEVCDAASAVLLHQDVLGFQISVSDSWFACSKI